MDENEARGRADDPKEEQDARLADGPTARFTTRVENYLKARPGYPAEIVALLQERCGLTRKAVLVDVGCGTGLLAKVFCEFGCRVLGVEPNAAMREAGRRSLAAYPNFEMRDGQAEFLPFAAASADFITAGQAFHWFDLDRSRQEFMRILKPAGWAVLVWNDRELAGSKFAEDYESLVVRLGTDYPGVRQRGQATLAAFERFFGNRAFARHSYPNRQELDYPGFVARALSSSYMPAPGHPDHPATMLALDRIFREHETAGVVTMCYTTTVTYGQMS
jgi:SAM-dependent methyltransferase